MIITTRTCCCYCCCCSLKTSLFLYCMLFSGISANFIFSSRQLVGLLNVRTTWFTFFPAIETMFFSRKFVKLFYTNRVEPLKIKLLTVSAYLLCLVISSPLLYLCLSQTFYFVCPSVRSTIPSFCQPSIHQPTRLAVHPSKHTCVHPSTHLPTHLSYQPPTQPFTSPTKIHPSVHPSKHNPSIHQPSILPPTHPSFHQPSPNPSVRPPTHRPTHPSEHPSIQPPDFPFFRLCISLILLLSLPHFLHLSSPDHNAVRKDVKTCSCKLGNCCSGKS